MLFGVVATVGGLVAMHMSDGVIALGACGALLAAVVALLMLSNFFESQQKVEFILEESGQGMLLRSAAGEVLAQSSDGSLTLHHATHTDYVRKKFVLRAVVRVASRGTSVGFVLYRGSRVVPQRAPAVDPKLPHATTISDAQFSAVQRLVVG